MLCAQCGNQVSEEDDAEKVEELEEEIRQLTQKLAFACTSHAFRG
jgi:transcription initiation factor IIE alpha subunit